jgi:hypothetical protein
MTRCRRRCRSLPLNPIRWRRSNPIAALSLNSAIRPSGASSEWAPPSPPPPPTSASDVSDINLALVWAALGHGELVDAGQHWDSSPTGQLGQTGIGRNAPASLTAHWRPCCQTSTWPAGQLSPGVRSGGPASVLRDRRPAYSIDVRPDDGRPARARVCKFYSAKKFGFVMGSRKQTNCVPRRRARRPPLDLPPSQLVRILFGAQVAAASGGDPVGLGSDRPPPPPPPTPPPPPAQPASWTNSPERASNCALSCHD